MGGGPTVNYTPPPPDDSFANYLEYVKGRDALADERAAGERADAKAEEEARKAAGASSFGGFKATTRQMLSGGLITLEGAQDRLRDYAAKYDLAPPEQAIQNITQRYLTALPGKRETQIGAAYEEILGRDPTKKELSTAQERFSQGYYSSVTDLKDSLVKNPEYQEKFNQSYLDNYYDTMFGKQTVDKKGKKTGKRTFTFAKNLLPQYDGDLASRTKVNIPDFGDSFTGTAAEIEEQQQNIRDTRQFLYSAGLTNLQGEIDKETQSLKNEGAEEVARIAATGNMYSSLFSGFWS